MVLAHPPRHARPAHPPAPANSNRLARRQSRPGIHSRRLGCCCIGRPRMGTPQLAPRHHRHGWPRHSPRHDRPGSRDIDPPPRRTACRSPAGGISFPGHAQATPLARHFHFLHGTSRLQPPRGFSGHILCPQSGQRAAAALGRSGHERRPQIPGQHQLLAGQEKTVLPPLRRARPTHRPTRQPLSVFAQRICGCHQIAQQIGLRLLPRLEHAGKPAPRPGNRMGRSICQRPISGHLRNVHPRGRGHAGLRKRSARPGRRALQNALRTHVVRPAANKLI